MKLRTWGRWLGAGLAPLWLMGIEPIPAIEVPQAPTPTRLAAIIREAAPEKWPEAVATLRRAARSAYEQDKLAAAAAWLRAATWAGWWAKTDAEFVPAWIKAIESAQVGHSNMPSRFELGARPLGRFLAPDFQAWLLGNDRFGDEFFEIVTPQDYLPETFRILNELYRHDRAKFASNPSLALAIAVVYDVAPPPGWPHGQVTANALPRRLPEPIAAFDWWVREETAGRLFHRPSRLPAKHLKFVVDTAAPFDQLTWCQQITDYPLAQLDRAYTMVRYRQDRVANGNPIWPGSAYTLPFILRDGGICVDQAYFATHMGKARGVPTLLYSGAGNDGRHAWFGYLAADQKWRFDVGRYAEQRFVTGFAYDPQTWRRVTDHELKFLNEGFRDLPPFRQSSVHAAFSADYLATGAREAAVRAARKAVTLERRNVAAWENLILAEAAAGRDARQREKLLREATLAFQSYPDIEAGFAKRVSASLRARGELSAAEAEDRLLARKHQSKRVDLSTQQAREILVRSLEGGSLPAQFQAFNSVLESFGRGAGIGFFDEVVVTFVQHLVRVGDKPAAERAITQARRFLKAEPNSQLEEDFSKLQRLVRGK